MSLILEMLVLGLGTMEVKYHLDDWARFPPKAACCDRFQMARKEREALCNQAMFCGSLWAANWIRDAHADAMWRENVWFQVWCVVEPFPSDDFAQRVFRANGLRRTVGDQCYYSASWPEPIGRWPLACGAMFSK